MHDLALIEEYFLSIVHRLHYEKRLWAGSYSLFKGAQYHTLPSNVGARVVYPHGRTGEFHLQINRKYWDALNEEQQKGLIRHEAIHVGHDRHDRIFRLIAQSIDAPFKGADLFGNKYKVYAVDKGKQTIILAEYDDYDSAREFAKLTVQKWRKEKDYRFVRIGVTNK